MSGTGARMALEPATTPLEKAGKAGLPHPQDSPAVEAPRSPGEAAVQQLDGALAGAAARASPAAPPGHGRREQLPANQAEQPQARAQAAQTVREEPDKKVEKVKKGKKTKQTTKERDEQKKKLRLASETKAAAELAHVCFGGICIYVINVFTNQSNPTNHVFVFENENL